MADQLVERVLLGHVTGVSGLKGWIKVHSDTSPRENIVAYSVWWIEQAGQWTRVKVLDGRPQGKTIVAQLEGFSNPEQAGTLIKARIAVDRSDMPQLAGPEYYWADLVGMQVLTNDGVAVGPVDRLFETGANDVMVVADTRDHHELESDEATADGQAGVGNMDAGQNGKQPGKGRTGGVKEVLVPWLVPDVIKEVNLESRTIVVDWDPDF